MSRYICVDIGGTSIKHGVLDENAIIEESNQTKTEKKLKLDIIRLDILRF